MGENMAEDIKTSVQNFNTDAQTAEEVVNGNESGKVVARLGREYPTLPAAIEEIMKAGGYFDSYATLAEANAKVAEIPLNRLVRVLSATEGGDYYKASSDATTLTKSQWDPVEQAKKYTDTQSSIVAESYALKTTVQLQVTGNESLVDWADENGNVVATLKSDGSLSSQNFKTDMADLNIIGASVDRQDAGSFAHIFPDNNGNILFGIYQDGTIYGESPALRGYGLAEVRAGVASSADMNAIGMKLDAIHQNEVPLNFDVLASPHGADETLHQRMPSAIKLSDTRIFIAFSQFSTASTDTKDGRLVGRFLDFDLVNKTSVLSETVLIDGNKIGSLSRHPVFVQLKNKIILLFNSGADLVQMESFDKCQTWVNRKVISIAGFAPYALGLDTAVRITNGLYTGRVCLAVYTQNTIGVMYSDDNCETWSAGGILDGNMAFPATPKINEPSLALDASQNLIIAMRHEDYTAANRYILFARSKDGGQSIIPIGMNPKVQTSACQIGFKQVAPAIFENVPKVIMAHPTTPSFQRRAFRVRVSYDNCQSFVSEYAPFPDTLDVAYSSICILNNSTFALVYEEGPTNQTQSIKIKFLNLAEIM
jgi:BNR repeat-like domain